MKISSLFLSLCLANAVFLPRMVSSEPVENAAQPSTLMTLVSGVKLHAEPSTNAKEIGRLPIGSVLNKLEKSSQTSLLGQERNYWYKVSLADAKQGWVFGSFVVAVDRSQLLEKYTEIAEMQLKVDPPVFKDLVEVVGLLDRVIKTLPASEKLGELKLLKLLAVERSLTVITPEQEKQSPYKEWFVAQAPILLRNEVMAGWMLNAEVFWKLSSEYAETPLGDKVARLYTDFGLLTANEEVTHDVAEVFKQLTGLGKARTLKQLWQAPFTLQPNVVIAIQAEAEAAKAGRKGRVVAKMNSLLEPEVIDALYQASQAGVEIDLIVRGVCALRPGVPGLSENIRVRSIIGRFLEHHRIFYFHADGKEQVYLSSADWMERNFFKRIELAFPILDPKLKKRVINEGLKFYLADNQQGWDMNSQGQYQRRRSARAKPHSAQSELMLTLGNL